MSRHLLPTHPGDRVIRARLGSAGFSLVELLTVTAILGVLMALIIPSVGSVRTAASRAKSRAQFAQWALAIESFRNEYGFYPVFDTSNLVNPDGQNLDGAAEHRFHDLLAGRRRDGSALPSFGVLTPATAVESQNRKLIAFHTFSEAEMSPSAPGANLVRDGHQNTAIAVLVDRNLDGVINIADYGPDLPLVRGVRPNATDFPANGIRAGVIFYSAAPGSTAEAPAFIFSWK